MVFEHEDQKPWLASPWKDGQGSEHEAESLKRRLRTAWPGVVVKLLLVAKSAPGASDAARATNTSDLRLVRCFTGLRKEWGDGRAYWCDWELEGDAEVLLSMLGGEVAVTFLDQQLRARYANRALPISPPCASARVWPADYATTRRCLLR